MTRIVKPASIANSMALRLAKISNNLLIIAPNPFKGVKLSWLNANETYLWATWPKA